MLQIKNITKSFGGVNAVKGSNFLVAKGKITALIGPNGAGKTTLFDIISGLLPADSGEINFVGENITKLDPHDRANLGISRTFQQVRLFHYLSIVDHLEMVKDNSDTKLFRNVFSNVKYFRQEYRQILEDFGIKQDPKVIVSELSYGQRKLLQLAMAFNKPHNILLLDEPVAGVNKVIQQTIEDLLLKLKEKGETILLIDHDMDFVRRLSDHIIVLDAGEVLIEGEPSKVLSDPRVLEAYLGE
jgi:branched-chain amino acid transport system ATP-binding protein